MVIDPEIVDGKPSDIVVHQESNTQVVNKESPGFLSMEPEAMVKYATRVANSLKEIITKQGLSVEIQRGQKPYVRVEGWLTLGSLLGILPKEDYVKLHEDGTYEVGISLIRQNDGRVLSSASAICGGDERTWANRPRYARRSMAATRATGKAYRMAFGWVMALAGYNPTPAEEMPEPELDIPFSPGPEIYVGGERQKHALKKIFDEKKITEAEKMKAANDILLKAKIGMEDLEAAVQELVDEKRI